MWKRGIGCCLEEGRRRQRKRKGEGKGKGKGKRKGRKKGKPSDCLRLETTSLKYLNQVSFSCFEFP